MTSSSGKITIQATRKGHAIYGKNQNKCSLRKKQLRVHYWTHSSVSLSETAHELDSVGPSSHIIRWFQQQSIINWIVWKLCEQVSQNHVSLIIIASVSLLQVTPMATCRSPMDRSTWLMDGLAWYVGIRLSWKWCSLHYSYTWKWTWKLSARQNLPSG